MKTRLARERSGGEGGKLGRELWGMFAIFCGLLLILSLATFDGRDPWLNHVVSEVTRVYNKAGLFGSYVSGFLFDILGYSAWLIPAWLCFAGVRRILGAGEWPLSRWSGFGLAVVCLCMTGAAGDLGYLDMLSRSAEHPQGTGNVSTHGGGIIGHMVFTALMGWLSGPGTLLVWIFCLLLTIQMLTGISWLVLIVAGSSALWHAFLGFLEDAAEKRRAFQEARRRARKKPLTLATSATPVDSTRTPVVQPMPVNSQDAFNFEEERRIGGFEEQHSGRYDSTDTGAFFPADVAREDRDKWPEPDNPVQRDAAQETLKSHSSSASSSSLLHPVLQRFSNKKNAAEPSIENNELQLPEPVQFTEPYATTLNPVQVPIPVTSPGQRFTPAPDEDEEVDLPPWVRDFEQDRLGAPETSVYEHYERKESVVQPMPGVAPSLAEDSDILDQIMQVPVLDRPTERAPLVETVQVSTDTAQQPLPEVHSEGLDASNYDEDDEEIFDEDDIPIHETPKIALTEPSLVPRVVNAAMRTVSRKVKAPLPPIDLLEATKNSGQVTPRSVLESKGRSLMTCLKDFGINGELTGITPGPVVTMFEVRPAPGVRVSRIANLNDDLALALKAVAVRIQAPIPGTDTVGIEIPNENRETVCLRELLSSQVFADSKSLLTLVLGKDIAGRPAVADLATMPHLLVAGATGAGKSVGINSIILSLIYKARPEEVKLLLVDPKRVEMAIYADLPHLVHPVVTEMQLAKNALEWAVSEMEQRYNAIARAGVRHISDYNAKVASWGDNPPEGLDDLVFMPYLVVIIDELADLMLVAAKEVETSIVRLAQLARAAGIHLILATQRPSVDVVTGLIKANFPCRMAFQVTSKHDSRTILDTVGAEHLLGKGDMLFKPGGGKFRRLHGAFVSDKNVNAVVEYWKRQQRPDYQIDFADWTPEPSGSGVLGGNGGGGEVGSDPLYNEAVEFVRCQGKASISLIQRKFRIGFNKAARFVEQMENDGVIGPADGSKPRMVIR